MSQNIGTLISAAIRPNDSNDPIASAFATEIRGGLHVATSSTDRDAIIVQRREWGMMCYVTNDDLTYQLVYGLNSFNITDNANWSIFSGGGGNEWIDSVISFESTEPVSPSNQDRYILGPSPTGVNWSGFNQGDVVQWDGVNSFWLVKQPTNGTSVRVDSEDNAIYRYEGIYPAGTWEKEKESQVRYLNVTSIDGFSFSATSNPTFNQYDPETVFIAKFSGTNFGVTASLNINGLGEVRIKKTFGQSLTGLVPNDISFNYPYTLTYDGADFILTKPAQDNVSFNVQYQVESSDYIIIPPNTQYWVYGDLTLNGGSIDNFGQVVVTNGSIISGTTGYTFSNYNTLTLNSFAEIDGLGQPNYVPRWKSSYMMTATSSITDDGETVQIVGNTFSILSAVVIPTGASGGYVLTSDNNGVATWQSVSGGSGTSGTSGATGPTGSNGTSGVNGTSGINGTSGVNGTSGTDGTSGVNGTSGTNGSSGTSGLLSLTGTTDNGLITLNGSSPNGTVESNFTFDGSTLTLIGASTFSGTFSLIGDFNVLGKTVLTNYSPSTLTIIGSGSSASLPIMSIQGISGELFSITDSLIGSLFSVNNIAGLPVLEVFSDDTILMGAYAAPSLNTTVKTTVNTGQTTIYSIPTSTYTGAFFEYTINDGVNLRAGNITSVWLGTTVSYVETSTNDIGNTSGFTFSVATSGGNAQLIASASSNSWVVKTIVRSI